MSHFAKVTRVPGDPTLDLLDAYRNDPHADKLDLGIGVYKDAQGLTPILRPVKLTEQRLVEQETTRSYVGGHGDALFAVRLAELALNAASPLLLEQRVDATQAPGDIGTLRLADDFIVHCLPGRGIQLSGPTWPIHEALFAAAGLRVSHYPHVSTNNRLNVKAMLAGLERTPQGDVVLLHTCRHNPIGFDLDHDDRHRVFDVVHRHELLSPIDFTYQGFGNGLEEDAWAVHLFAGGLPEVLVISSYSKNFDLYRDHVDAPVVCAQNTEKLTDVRSQLALLARNLWSAPPAHSAEVVAVTLSDSELRGFWQKETESMRSRIASLYTGLVEALVPHGLAECLAHVGAQRGMFSYTGLSPQQVARLCGEHAVHLASSSRANVVDLDARRLDRLARAITQVCAD